MNRLRSLQDYGQAVWLDFVARRFITEGDLKKLIDEDGLRGVTSNPAIFEKAIGHSEDYDGSLKAAEAHADLEVKALYERLAVEDIQQAADILRPVYQTTKQRDGFVSLEVSPYLAMDTNDTVEEARRLWHAVDRENLMIKVPGTAPGLPAIRTLLGEGININVTLLFSQAVYEQVADAYLGGLEDLVAQGGDPRRVASVASFFVSRIDAAIDKQIGERLEGVNDPELRPALERVRGKVAIANAKLAYQRYKRLFSGPRWERLVAEGARPQRLLWASTGTKNPAYRDVLYIEELIGADTVNTMPPATMDAFRDHGHPRASLEEGVAEAERVMASLARVGISIDEVTAKLVEDGVQLSADAADQLLGAVAKKRALLLGSRLNRQSHTLPAAFNTAVNEALEDWRRHGKIRRLWAGDAVLWTGKDEPDWLGWLTIVGEQRTRLDQLRAFAEEVRAADFRHVLLLGMGGSSLGPEVLAETFGRQSYAPELLVLDSTDPAQIREFERRIDPARTLFIVSSKSGSTLEPNVLQQYFSERVRQAVGEEQAGRHFIAITDPGSAMQKVAERDQFRHIFFGKPSIGGRYSVLSDFGMVPAAAMSLDLSRLLEATTAMVRSCCASAPPADNPGVVLGAIMGTFARSGRDKVTIVASPAIAGLGAWLEQLLAESTGKQGKGLIPVDGEPLGPPDVYGDDRLFAYLRLDRDVDVAQDQAMVALEAAGQPVVRIEIADRYQIGQEFFRWEIATAVAGSIIGIDPFDQPDVEASKVRTRELTSVYERDGALPEETPVFEGDGFKLLADPANASALRTAGEPGSVASYLKRHLDRLGPGDYCALLAYVARNKAHHEQLQAIRRLIRDRKRVATCLGFGPRFLHSTGQAYKGGPNSGVFLQITCDDGTDLEVPGQKYSLGVVKAAQARGDFEVLAARSRRALRVHLRADIQAGLGTLEHAVRQALA
jgi:transaldolase/glucose-6-phosphate isomerase